MEGCVSQHLVSVTKHLRAPLMRIEYMRMVSRGFNYSLFGVCNEAPRHEEGFQ